LLIHKAPHRKVFEKSFFLIKSFDFLSPLQKFQTSSAPDAAMGKQSQINDFRVINL